MLNFIRHSSDHFRCEHFCKGSIIFNIGDQPDKFYFILKGEIGVFAPKNSDEIRSARHEVILSPLPKLGEKIQFLSPIPQKLAEISYENFFLSTSEIKRHYFHEEVFMFKMIKVLREKDCFGELALSNNKPRSATILALDELTVLTLKKQDFELDFENMIKESQEKFDFFQKLFEMNSNSSSSTSLMRLIYYFNEVEFQPNQVIFHEGDQSNAFYVIFNGEIEISQNYFGNDKEIIGFGTGLGLMKKQKTLLNVAKLGPFNLLGEGDLINDKNKRTYTATTITHAKLYSISKKVKRKKRLFCIEIFFVFLLEIWTYDKEFPTDFQHV